MDLLDQQQEVNFSLSILHRSVLPGQDSVTGQETSIILLIHVSEKVPEVESTRKGKMSIKVIQNRPWCPDLDLNPGRASTLLQPGNSFRLCLRG